MFNFLGIFKLIKNMGNKINIVFTEDETVNLMNSSNGPEEWNKNCKKIKKMFNGYPDFWYKAVIEPNLSKIRTEIYLL